MIKIVNTAIRDISSSYRDELTVDLSSLYDNVSNIRQSGGFTRPVRLSDFVTNDEIVLKTKLDKFIFDNCLSSEDVRNEIDNQYQNLNVQDNVATRKRDIAYDKMKLNCADQLYTTNDLLPTSSSLGTVKYLDRVYVPVMYPDLSTMIRRYEPDKSEVVDYSSEQKMIQKRAAVASKPEEKDASKTDVTISDKGNILRGMDTNSAVYDICIDRYFDEIKKLNPQARVPSSTHLMSGTNMELYVFDAKPMPVGKSGIRHNSVLIAARQRRDVDPNAKYAGSFVSNKAMGGYHSQRVSHWQPVSLQVWNQMLDYNDIPMISREEFHQKQDGGKHLMRKSDSIAFTGNIFVDKSSKQPDGRFTYLINPKSDKIMKSPYYFDVKYEHKLDEQRRQQRERDMIYLENMQLNHPDL